MSLNDIPSGQRIHIGFFGLTNAGKSSLVNAITGQSLSIVSQVKGTTTDPVKKAMELLPLGPVVIIDTPGLDDCGELGQLRIEKAQRTLTQTDLAVLVVDSTIGLRPEDHTLFSMLQERKIPFLIAYNKSELLSSPPPLGENELYVSAATGIGIRELKEKLGSFAAQLHKERPLCSDLFSPGDLILLVTPIDASAPKGRLILPQQLVLRDILDHHGIAVVCQDGDVERTLSALASAPRLVITDSQAFDQVSRVVPPQIPLTSFSILMARYKGKLLPLVQAAAALSSLKDGDPVLISEGCTHHRQCNDLGSVKLPDWIRQFTSSNPSFSFTSGGEFPTSLAGFRLVVHCGGCMLNEKEMQHRQELCRLSGVPMVNYGIAIAQIHGVLRRSLELFPEAAALLESQ